jgi:hypothetical protein
MESLPARKTRPSLAVEPLEDRRLLSMFAPASGWEDYGRPMETQAETGPISGGSVAPMRGDGLDPSISDRDPSEWFDSPGFDHQGVSNSPDPEPGEWSLTSSMAPTSATMPETQTGTDSGPGGLEMPRSSSYEPSATSPPTDDRGSGENSIASAAATATTNWPSTSPSSMVLPLSLPTRSAPGLSMARSASEPVSNSAKGDIGAVGPQAGRASSDETLLALASANAPASEASASQDQARALVSINLPIGPGLNGLQTLSGLTLSTTKAPTDLPAPAETPIGSGELTRVAELPSGSGSPSEGGSVETVQSFLPFDRSSMEGAIDLFLEPFDGLASTMTELRGPMGLITASLATAATVVAVEVAIRLRRDREQELGADEVDDLTTFPGI